MAIRSSKPVVLLGIATTSGNRGVLALGASLIGLCTRQAPDSGPLLLLRTRHATPAPFRINGHKTIIPVIHARMHPRTHPRHHFICILMAAAFYRAVPPLRKFIASQVRWISALRDASLVGDIRGGDSFSDIYGMRRFLLGFLTAWTVVLVKGSIVQFPQTYGPYKSPIARVLARYLLRRSSVIIARDRASQKVAQDLVGPRKSVLLSPDVAFSLDPVLPPQIELDPPATAGTTSGLLKAGVIGLNVNGLMYHGGYDRQNMFGLKLDYPLFLRRLLEGLLASQPGEVWLVPHTFAADGNVESDPAACRAVRDALAPGLRQRVRIINHDYDCHELKAIIGQCDFLVGSRMHACIAALSQGVPCVGVAYSMKFAGVFESVGMESWVVDGRDADTDTAVQRVMELYRGRNQVRTGLKKQALAARAKLDTVFAQLFSVEAQLPTPAPPVTAPAATPASPALP